MTTHLITTRPDRIASPAAMSLVSDAHDVETPDYLMRRIGAVVVVACSLLIASVVATSAIDAVSGLGGRPAAASETAAQAGSAPSIHVAAPGDTIWSIAERFRGDIGLNRYVDALIQSNGGTAIQVGQAVRLP